MTFEDRFASMLTNAAGKAQPGAEGDEPKTTLPLPKLVAGQFQPRRHFDEASMAELVRSVQEKGILQPLLVRPLGEKYEIVAGERRYRAALAVGLSEVPVFIRDLTNQEAASIGLIENLQREDLSIIDEIDGKLQLISFALNIPLAQVPARLTQLRRDPEHSDAHIVATVFAPLGEKWESFATNKLRVLNYPQPLLDAMRRGMALTLATRIARVPAEAQPPLIARAEAGATRKEIEREIARLTKPAKAAPTPVKEVGRLLTSKKLDLLSPEAAQRVQLWLEQMPSDLRELLGTKS